MTRIRRSSRASASAIPPVRSLEPSFTTMISKLSVSFAISNRTASTVARMFSSSLKAGSTIESPSLTRLSVPLTSSESPASITTPQPSMRSRLQHHEPPRGVSVASHDLRDRREAIRQFTELLAFQYDCVRGALLEKLHDAIRPSEGGNRQRCIIHDVVGSFASDANFRAGREQGCERPAHFRSVVEGVPRIDQRPHRGRPQSKNRGGQEDDRGRRLTALEKDETA